MRSISLKEAKDNLNIIIEDVNASTPLLIENENGKNCYLVSENYFNSLIETIHLDSIYGLASSIIKEGQTSYKDTTNVDELNW